MEDRGRDAAGVASMIAERLDKKLTGPGAGKLFAGSRVR